MRKHKNHAPAVHNLNRLVNLSGIEVPEDKLNMLIEISAFNIEQGV